MYLYKNNKPGGKQNFLCQNEIIQLKKLDFYL